MGYMTKLPFCQAAMIFISAMIASGCGSILAENDRCDLRHVFYDKAESSNSSRETPPGMEILTYRTTLNSVCQDFVYNRSGGVDLTLSASSPDASSFLRELNLGTGRSIVFSDQEASMVGGSILLLRSYEGRRGAFQLPWADSPTESFIYFAVPKNLQPSLYPSGVVVKLAVNETTL